MPEGGGPGLPFTTGRSAKEHSGLLQSDLPPFPSLLTPPLSLSLSHLQYLSKNTLTAYEVNTAFVYLKMHYVARSPQFRNLQVDEEFLPRCLSYWDTPGKMLRSSELG